MTHRTATTLLLLVSLVFGALAGPARAAAQNEPESTPDPALLVGAGAGLLLTGVALDGLVFAFVDDAAWNSPGGEAGFALAVPPVMVAGGIFATSAGIALAAGADPDTALSVGAGLSLAAGAALTAVAVLVGLDPDACVGQLCGERAGGFLGAHAGASLLTGGLVMGLVAAE